MAKPPSNSAVSNIRVEKSEVKPGCVVELSVAVPMDVLAMSYENAIDEAIAQADAEISERAAESEKAIADIRATAVDNVREVATATAEELVAALGGKADAAAVKAAVEDRMKG